MPDIKVFIVDDSAVVRQVLTALLSEIHGITVIGVAPDPLFALKRMESDWPDVIVLDIEMPRMDGITFLKKLMQERPTPVVICSTLTAKGAEVTMQAMSAGAVDIITKPTVNLKGFLQDSRTLLADAIKAASHARIKKMPTAAAQPLDVKPKLNADPVIMPSGLAPMSETTDRVIAIGTSTGGTQALEYVLTRLPRTVPGIVIVQHMPEAFTAAFAKRLDSLAQISIKEAEQNDRVIPGLALIAPGGKHMLLRRSGAQYRVEIKDGPLVSRHRPSVDVLFRSTAQAAGKNAIGIIMTGMGDDGARGLKELHDTGALTVAQDEASCVVYGMPKEAVKLGATDAEFSLSAIPELIIRAPSRAKLLKA
ncbi:chemotaxis response regulator protein-glutamate methylesterase [Methylomonas sp. SURF-2]|uniref:Protein-glutamate methylesterase/protein-glutamine glutaminase n=1 Tax=Methylomonas subterranea TaxID=2952225 RepID=A0ABT1THS3_9GAMM|nr:chemotaxis response regulator protein-glutamate methylesterase [Methylomonas sp. SURF-2]MCQ8104808.1 chemotaxis response regulator protein-glutamate methylesterase [Methylomonas sp. SURF-2]